VATIAKDDEEQLDSRPNCIRNSSWCRHKGHA